MLLNILLISWIIQVNGIDFYREEMIRNGEKYQFNIYHHLSGISPYFESSNKEELNENLPSYCSIDKMIYLIRHGSVYVDDYDYFHFIKPFIKGLNKSMNSIRYKSSKLSFLSKWKSPFTNEKNQIEKLTRTGYLESYQLGVELSYRYSNILSKENQSSFHIWTSSSERTKDTASYILKGIFPRRNPKDGIVLISEDKSRGANSLLPTKGCQKFQSAKGSKEAEKWLNIYTKPIMKRLNSMVGNIRFSPKNIFAMQMLCGYETAIRGSSPFCQLFRAEEWISFEYYFDIKYHYELGYGNHLSPYLGIHWVKAMSDTFKSKDHKFYISVVHREMLPVVLVALGLYNYSNYPLENRMNLDRPWRSSEILPFLGRIQLEVFSCSSIEFSGSFVRVIVNGNPKILPGCSQGPGFSCALTDFVQYVDQRYKTYQNFSQACQLNQTKTFDHLTFYQNKSF